MYTAIRSLILQAKILQESIGSQEISCQQICWIFSKENIFQGEGLEGEVFSYELIGDIEILCLRIVWV